MYNLIVKGISVSYWFVDKVRGFLEYYKTKDNTFHCFTTCWRKFDSSYWWSLSPYLFRKRDNLCD